MSLKKQVVIKQNIHTAASALVRYATHDTPFADRFAALISQNLPDTLYTAPAPFTAATFSIPKNREAADIKAAWLISELVYYPTAQTDITAQALISWARERKEPQDLVLGLVGMAIIGPTLGLVDKKKRHRSQMRIVFNEQAVDTSRATTLAKLSQSASAALIGNELAAVGGDSNRLDPELAEWLFVDQETNFYGADTVHIHNLRTALMRDNIAHFCVTYDDVVHAIAITPAANEQVAYGEMIS